MCTKNTRFVHKRLASDARISKVKKSKHSTKLKKSEGFAKYSKRGLL